MKHLMIYISSICMAMILLVGCSSLQKENTIVYRKDDFVVYEEAAKNAQVDTKAWNYVSPVHKGSIFEVKKYLHEQAENLATEIQISYDDEAKYIFDNKDRICELTYNMGMYQCSWVFPKSNEIRIYNIKYYPGYEIYRSTVLGKVNSLSSEEKKALEVAKEIARNAKSYRYFKYDNLNAEKYIHDYLCRTITYQRSDKTHEYRNHVIGALLYQDCECDGYADAFYLIGRLCGLEVGYQDGKSRDGELHLWNTFRSDEYDQFMIDVTWDDYDDADKEMFSYHYFNTSKEIDDGLHVWDDLLSVDSISEFRAHNYFYVNEGTVFDTYNEMKNYCWNMYNNGYRYLNVRLNGPLNDAEFLRQTASLPSFYYYYIYTDNYTTYTIRFD